jgi:hypothetical protein
MYAAVDVPHDHRPIVHSRSQPQRRRRSPRILSVLHNTAALDHSFRSTLRQMDHILCPGCRPAEVTWIYRQRSGPVTVLFNWTSTRHHTRSGHPQQIFPSLTMSPRSSITSAYLTCVNDGIPSQYVRFCSQSRLSLTHMSAAHQSTS